MMADEKKEMKKEYVAPRMEILAYDVQGALLLECSPNCGGDVVITGNDE
jgi:hypothetical protein